MRIEVWSDVVCPWCYIGKRRLEAALAEFPHRDEVEVEYKSFLLDPDAPAVATQTSAEHLAGRYGGPARVAEMFERVTELASAEGLDFKLETAHHVGTTNAHRVLHLARQTSPELQSTLNEALLAAHFERNENIGDPEVLVRIAAEHGLDAERVREVLAGDEFTLDVERDIQQAQSFGATGVPFYVIDRKYGISGAQPKELFAQALETAYAEQSA